MEGQKDGKHTVCCKKNPRQTFMMNDCCNYTCQKVCDVLSQRVIQIASLWGNNEYIKEFIIKGASCCMQYKALFFLWKRRKINQNTYWICMYSKSTYNNFFYKIILKANNSCQVFKTMLNVRTYCTESSLKS